MRGMRAALAASSTVAALVLAEWLLGGPLRPEVVDQRDAAWQARVLHLHTELYQPDGELQYVPRPDAAVEMEYGPAAHNGQGLREPALVPPSPGSEVRVAMLGDSLVWGELLAEGDSLPSALERALGPGHEVLNLGVTGYDTAQEAGWYRRAGRPLQPDVVVLVVCLNDLLTMSGPLQVHGQPAAIEAWEQERAWLDAAAPVRNETVSRLWLESRRGGGSQVLAAARHVGRWHRLFSLPGGYVDELLLSARDPARRQRFADALFRLGADLRADGARPALFLSPALYWWHRYQWQELHDLVHAAGRDAGFEVLDPLPDWREQDPSAWRFPGDNLHYTAHGTERAAAWLSAALGPLSRRPRAPAPAPTTGSPPPAP